MSKRERLRRINLKQAIGLLVTIGLLIAGFYTYGYYAERAGTLEVWFENGGRRTSSYRLRLATSESERQKGLMYVRAEELEPNKGMLFVFPEEQQQSFWMKDTYAPLDMIFIDKGQQVVGVVHDAAPYTLERRSVDKPSKFVVELLAGTAKRDGIIAGSKMVAKGLEALPIQ